MSALEHQVGGDHYKRQAIQPIELAYMVGGTPAFCKVAKYVTREKGDHGENIRKAIHCIELEATLSGYNIYYRKHQKFMDHMVCMFTDEDRFQRALISLRKGNYTQARDALVEYLKAYK